MAAVRWDAGVGLVATEGASGLGGRAAGDSGADGWRTTPGGAATGAGSSAGSSEGVGSGWVDSVSSAAKGAETDSSCCGTRGSSSHVGAWTVVGSSQPVVVETGSVASRGGVDSRYCTGAGGGVETVTGAGGGAGTGRGAGFSCFLRSRNQFDVRLVGYCPSLPCNLRP